MKVEEQKIIQSHQVRKYNVTLNRYLFKNVNLLQDIFSVHSSSF